MYSEREKLFTESTAILTAKHSLTTVPHIVYVNGAYRGADAIGDLMHDFFCRKSGEMKAEVLSSRAKYLKGNEQEVTKMSYVVEELINKTNIDTAAVLLAEGDMTETRIETVFRFTPEQMAEVRELAREKKSSAPA